MSKKIKRSASSFSFRLRKFWDRIITYKPSIWIIGGAIIMISVFLLGGGIYDILEKPIVAGTLRSQSGQGRIAFFYPRGLNLQFLAESIFVIILYGLGAIGLILTYQSTKYVYKPRQAYILLMVGVSLIIVTYLLLELSLKQKI